MEIPLPFSKISLAFGNPISIPAKLSPDQVLIWAATLFKAMIRLDKKAEYIIHIDINLRDKDTFKFAVIGNIRNSMRIFERRIAPPIKNSDDFMVSLGNSVYDGSEGKYRLLYRGFKKLDIPYILTVGHNEIENFGAERFYRHFGPFMFSFSLKNTYFIFLDSTGQTSWKWVMRWLREELIVAEKYHYKSVFLNHSLSFLPDIDPDETKYVLSESQG